MTRTTAALAAVCLALVAAQPATAHGPAIATTAKAERQLQAFEIQVLGARHAAEHAAQRREARRLARSPAPRPRARASVDGPPEEIGAWTTPPFSLPGAFAIHTAMLPTGKILYYGFPLYPYVAGQGYPREGEAYLWNPEDGSFKRVPPPPDPDNAGKPAQVFCSGQSFLPDGRLLVTGGTILHPQDPGGRWTGLEKTWIFDPWTETWHTQPSMRDGRWYPTQVLMADGRTLIMGGLNRTGGQNADMEVFSQGGANGLTGRIDLVGSRRVDLYPHLFAMPNGRILLGGPGTADSALIDPAGWGIQNLSAVDRIRVGGTGVLRPAGPEGSTRVTLIGGYGAARARGDQATETSVTLDIAASSPSWQRDASLNLKRRHHNTVLLPDGSMVTIGGDTENGISRTDPKERQVELMPSGGGAWRLGPAQREDRAYHSTAVLLPDGRVFSGGDDLPANDTTRDTAEIYSPPYLFKGARPTIAGAPAAARWGARFGVETPDADVAQAVLVAPSAVTHSVDMNQRLVPLRLERTAGGVNLTAPPSAHVAPPGYYMLFLVNERGVPSVATWIRLHDGAPPTGPLEPPAPETPAPTPPSASPPAPASPPARPPAPGTTPAPTAVATPVPVAGPQPTATPAPPARRTTTLSPVADARVAPRTARGRGVLRVARGTESHLRFTVPALSGRIARATLRVYASTATRNGPALHAAAPASWSETRITWRTRPRRTGRRLGDAGAIRARTSVTYDVTSRVTGAGAIGFVLTSTSRDAVDFHSREGARKPELVLEIT